MYNVFRTTASVLTTSPEKFLILTDDSLNHEFFLCPNLKIDDLLNNDLTAVIKIARIVGNDFGINIQGNFENQKEKLSERPSYMRLNNYHMKILSNKENQLQFFYERFDTINEPFCWHEYSLQKKSIYHIDEMEIYISKVDPDTGSVRVFIQSAFVEQFQISLKNCTYNISIHCQNASIIYFSTNAIHDNANPCTH